MKAPKTYAEWSFCLDRFETGGHDIDAIAAMRDGTLSWQGGVAPLFAKRISEVLDTRLRTIADGLSRGLRLGGDTTVLARSMLDARQKLATLHCLATLEVFPGELRSSLEGQIEQYAQTAQKALEDSSKHDRSGELSGTIRNTSLLRYRTTAGYNPATELAQPLSNNTTGLAASPRRRTILS
jgi:hypothetical protein